MTIFVQLSAIALLTMFLLRRGRQIPIALLVFNAGMIGSFCHHFEWGWMGYLVAINSLGALCFGLAMTMARRKRDDRASSEEMAARKQRQTEELARLQEQVQLLNDSLAAQNDLYEAAWKLAAVTSVNAFVEEIRPVLARFFRFESAWLVLADDDSAIRVWDISAGSVQGTGPFDRGFCDRLLAAHGVLYACDRRETRDHAAAPPSAQSFVGLPLLHQHEVRGCAVLLDAEPLRANRRYAHPDYVLEILRALQNQFSLSLNRVLLHDQTERLSRQDSLTQLSKVWYFMQRLGEEVERCLRRSNALTVLMADIDDFKQFNDAYGRLAGDQALHQTGEFLRNDLRLGDLICRYGGEEFLVALPATSKAKAEIVAERLRTKVRKLPLEIDGHKRHLTISLGIATFPEDHDDIDQVIDKAGGMLKLAQQVGHDTFCTYPGQTHAQAEPRRDASAS